MARMIMVDDEGNEFDVTERINEMVENALEIEQERDELEAQLEEVAASFEGVELSQETEESELSLSDEAFSLITGEQLELGSHPGVNPTSTSVKANTGANAGAVASPRGKVKPKIGAPKAGMIGNGTGKAAMKKGLRTAKAASIGKHIKHAGKVVSRFASKLSPTAGAAIGAGAGALAGTALGATIMKRKSANVNTSSRGVEASHDTPTGLRNHSIIQSDPQLQLDETEELIEEGEEMTQEEWDTYSPEEQEEIIQQYEAEQAAEFNSFASNVLITDAEKRNPTAK